MAISQLRSGQMQNLNQMQTPDKISSLLRQVGNVLTSTDQEGFFADHSATRPALQAVKQELMAMSEDELREVDFNTVFTKFESKFTELKTNGLNPNSTELDTSSETSLKDEQNSNGYFTALASVVQYGARVVNEAAQAVTGVVADRLQGRDPEEEMINNMIEMRLAQKLEHRTAIREAKNQERKFQRQEARAAKNQERKAQRQQRELDRRQAREARQSLLDLPIVPTTTPTSTTTTPTRTAAQ